MSRIVAIAGRPNVGKSTLFNRLTGGRSAIVDAVSGVTRDRHYGKVEWNGSDFILIDTGGYVDSKSDIMEAGIRQQAMFAIEEAEIILFVVDIIDGITYLDELIAGLLRKVINKGKKVILVANKTDSPDKATAAAEFYSLGFGEVYTISAMNGSGTGELLDEIIKTLPAGPQVTDNSELPKIAVVGKPNVGKSSFINALLEEERQMVTEIAGTTRDSIDLHFSRFGYDMMLIDTAGLRKRAKVHEDIEFYSNIRSETAIERADVCILITDATIGFEGQDLNVFAMAADYHKGIVVVVNKWDLVEKDNRSTNYYEDMITSRTAPFRDVPVVFTSVLQKQRVLKVLETVMMVYNNRKRKITTSKLNDILLPIIENYPPPSIKSKYVKIKYITQLPIAYPAFAFFCNLPQYINEPYKRFLENKIREHFDFKGTPIEIYFRKK
jgi:GTP-binding protein